MISILPKLRGKRCSKSFPVKICTLDADLEFNLDWRATGRELFDLVCRTVALRETWFFGLQFEDTKGFITWLKPDKKVTEQNIDSPANVQTFMLLAKFYPEDVTEELVQEVTRHLYFLQVKQAILSMDIYCPPETSVLLASYSVQAKFGDYDESTFKPEILSTEALLPQRVIDQYQMTPEMWIDRIKVWYSEHRGMSRDEAEIEYLKIAQNLDMYGVNYFPITNKKGTELWLGVTAIGLNVYAKENKLAPTINFTWAEIRHISFDDKKFILRTIDKTSQHFVFFSDKVRMNKYILDLCIGNHDLFMRRRRPDTFEVQQMKTQAKEERMRRQTERNKLVREKQLREAAERDCIILQERLLEYQEEVKVANEALRRSEETAELLAEKSKVAEEEAFLLSQKSNEAEQEIARMRLHALKSEEEKTVLERKTREAAFLTAKLVEESERLAKEAEELKYHLLKSRLSEKKLAKEKLLQVLSQAALHSYNPHSIYVGPDNLSDLPEDLQVLQLDAGTASPVPSDFGSNFDIMASLHQQLSLDIEKERLDYLTKSRQVQEQLQNLRTEIEELKVGEKSTDLDDLHEEQLRNGDNKYSTLSKVKSGSTKSRVACFEDL